ncbi:MAG: NAD(P)H-hydrate epimerase, partial [bacterium]|nr:NAD(P)H-hydrate epimerase [bacterium]
MEVLGAQRIRELDARAIAGGTPGSELMERAGYGAYLFLRRVAAPRAERVLVVAGKGNNAGDAFVVAYYLLAAGRHVELCLLGRGEEMSRDAGEKWERIRGLQVCHCYAGDAEAVWGCVRRWHGDVIVDGVLGTGVRGELAPAYRAAIEAMNAHPAPVLALDIPSGLDADTGEPHGVAVRAAWTVTFGHPKRGMMEAVAREYCGRIEVVDIGLEREGGEGGVKMLSSAEAGEMLPVRALDAHKHGCGHVLVVAGSRGMTGAAALCARAALASGAGLVTLAVPEALVGLVAPVNPACMTLPVPDGGTGEFGPGGLRVVTEFLRRCRALAIGPGMGRSVVVGEFLRGLLKEVRVPTVVDADGLNYLAEAGEVMEWLRGGRYVLTPHPGEFERLSGNRPG